MSVKVGPYEFRDVDYDPADILRVSNGPAFNVYFKETSLGDAWFGEGPDDVGGLQVMWAQARAAEGPLIIELPNAEIVHAPDLEAVLPQAEPTGS